VGGDVERAHYVTLTDWLAVGEGLLGFFLGIVVGVLYVLTRVVTGSGRGRHTRRGTGE
jgi:hypothetical protein